MLEEIPKNCQKGINIFSSPEPNAPGELIVYAGSVVRPSSIRLSTISNDFTDTTVLIATNFHISLQGL